MPEPTMSCVTAKTRGCEDTFTTRIPARPHRQDTTMYTHPYQAASLDHDRHRDIRADISSHRLARHLRDLATGARRARKTPHRPFLLHRFGFSPQVPAHRAFERDEDAVAAWRSATWAKARGSRR